ncbi:MAG: hypothetical protein ACI4WX_00835 [Aristaeellaceae bacterium]
MENDMISRKAIMDILHAKANMAVCSDAQKVFDHVANMIEKMPTVDAEPVRHGRWIFGEYDFIGYPVKCSECGLEVPHVNRDVWMKYDGHKYCGRCGAKMDRGA